MGRLFVLLILILLVASSVSMSVKLFFAGQTFFAICTTAFSVLVLAFVFRYFLYLINRPYQNMSQDEINRFTAAVDRTTPAG